MRRLERTTIPVVALSHPGVKRKENEDRFGVAAFSLGPHGPQPVLLAVLCDGIGGHRAGEVAAEMAVNLISKVVAESDANQPHKILARAIRLASDAIRDQAVENNEQAGMGATCACAWLVGERLYTATVGDSRIYLLRGGRIQRVSTDHTWVQEAIENGALRPDEIAGHPNAHIIRRYLGSPYPPEVDLRLRISGAETDDQALANQGAFLLPGDRILLTSDGLTDLVRDGEILEAFQLYPAEAAAQRLIDLANSRGGHDNITLISFETPSPAAHKEATRRVPVRASNRAAWRWAGLGCLGVLAVAAVAGLLAGGWWLLGGERLGAGPGAAASPTAVLSSPLPVTFTPAASFTARPSETPRPSPTPSRTLPSRSTLGGPTLTPWPTNTRAP